MSNEATNEDAVAVANIDDTHRKCIRLEETYALALQAWRLRAHYADDLERAFAAQYGAALAASDAKTEALRKVAADFATALARTLAERARIEERMFSRWADHLSSVERSRERNAA